MAVRQLSSKTRKQRQEERFRICSLSSVMYDVPEFDVEC